MKFKKGLLSLFVVFLVIIAPTLGSVTAQEETTVQPQKLWDKTYIIISLNDLKMVNDWDYIIKTLPKDHKGIMIMWYGLSKDYENDFNTVQKFIDKYKSAYHDKSVIELWMKTQVPGENNQTVNITTPIFKGVDYLITFDNVKDMINEIPKDVNVKIIASYVYEKRTVPVETNSTNSTNTTKTKTIINENPKWDEIVEIKKQDSRLAGVMIYTNDNEKLPELIQRARGLGLETYTIILPTPTLFGGVDMINTFQKIQSAVKVYDYVIFYSWGSITPDFNYLMSGGNTQNQLPSKEMSKWGKYGQWLPEYIVFAVIIFGVIYAISTTKDKYKGKKSNEKEKSSEKEKSKKK